MTSAPAWPALVFGWAMALGAVWLLAIVNASLARFRAQGLWMQHGAGAPAREVLRCLFKEPRDVHGADSLAWRLAPLLLLTLGGALLAFGPFGGALGLPAGLLVPLAALVLGAALQFVTGWAVNSGYALIGAGRALGLMVAALVPLALSLAALAVPAGSLQLDALVRSQQDSTWAIVQQPLGALLYLHCASLLAGWGPVDGPVDARLAGGVEAEMSGAPLLVWRLGRYLLLLGTATLAVPLYLGNGEGPILPPTAWVALKALGVAVIMLMAYHLLPRRSLSRAITESWRFLAPLALLNLAWALGLAVGGGLDGAAG